MASAVSKALVNARQKCLSEEEAYWDPKPDYSRPISARNEAAALSWLLDHQAVVCRGGAADVAELHALCADYCARLGALAPPEQQRQQGVQAEAGGEEAGGEDASSSGRTFEEASAEAALKRWCTEKGLKAMGSPALFAAAPAPDAAAAAAGGGGGSSCSSGAAAAAAAPPPLRGLRADSAVGPGDVVLHVPMELLISYESAKESDLGKVLAALPLGLGDDSIALIWTCVERHEPEAAAAAWWASLPQRFATVLSASDADVEAALAGSPLAAEAAEARRHLAEAFEASKPAFESLCKAYPDYFQPHWFSWESYLWAAELWYSYGIQVQVAAGDIRTCLVPYLGLMNHHPLPHVVHFSKVDAASGGLRVRAFRPCAAGRQLFLSYGPYSNSKLLLFYGFALPDNPVDEVELGPLQMPPGPTGTDRRGLLAAAGTGLEGHRLRLPPPGAPPSACMSPSLLAAARVLAAPPDQLKALKALPPAQLKALLTAPLRPAAGGQAAAGKEGDAVASAAAAAAAAARDAAAAALLLRRMAALSEPAAACAARLQKRAAAGAAEEEEGASTLPHFAGIYISGVVDILEATQRYLSSAAAAAST
ncbi:hypothetical protein HYH02_011557 [Chlamydomonas schloesseri]|uniref:SET domain-containing protein n=1 Tax=Chlamydomonas schloesseri TaxID=2026947 RepID=A0A835T411_9CHLO|nr:hypothetical protein HYH02_011557 [Chlamydomonas schloesseri]|eukprot:KAG2436622.1 hypothetical protein HYH02_011557 [Chlamydomonas schloesseri]